MEEVADKNVGVGFIGETSLGRGKQRLENRIVETRTWDMVCEEEKGGRTD